ncbi:MAG: type II secretion system protein [Nitrospirae bacterium]|uniref:type II secretion system protein n=1 Tax=Candidatus Magnetobacterium casense TaxID=1455061 RepID=UPI00058E844F|nr:type II secretion system protein [Candidatus Magnetobacterium casensis]MBF0339112.1 type II secretion system protein [Nitrospirota bacterium]
MIRRTRLLIVGGGNEGFTLVELLVVIAIIGILTTIGAMMYLGNRDKAAVRTIEASAKGAVADIQQYLDAYHAKGPFIVVDAAGTEICVQYSNPGTFNTCQAIFNQNNNGNVYSNINDIVNYVLAHHQGRKEVDPHSGSTFMFVNTATPWTIALTPLGTSGISIVGYAESTTTPIFSYSVVGR